MADSFVFNREGPRAPAAGKRKVLVTGAAGNIGLDFAQRNADRYDLRLMVHGADHPRELDGAGQVGQGDLTDLDSLQQLCADIDTVLHLAADASPEAEWDSLLRNNITGTYNLFMAAQAACCRRVVFASSIHAISGYPVMRQVHADDPVNPGDLYGVSKCFGEAMGRFMAAQRGLSVIVVRIGAFQPLSTAQDPANLGLIDGYISHHDMNDLLVRCIDDERLRFAIVHGLSNNAFNRMDITETIDLLGYAPTDDFARYSPPLANLHLHDRTTHSERDDGAD